MSSQYQYVVALDDSVSVTVTMDIAAEILENNLNIRQVTKEFSDFNDYELTIIPTNPIPRLGWVEIELPAGVGVVDKETLTSEYVDVD